MRYEEFIKEDVSRIVSEAKESIRSQILTAVRKDGGALNDYFVRFTDVDRLGYSAKQTFARSPDLGDPKFDLDYIGSGVGRPALWFYPLKYYLNSKEAYATEKPYIWLIKIRPNAWLQPVKSNQDKIKNQAGKERVGIIKTSGGVPAAIFFKPAFDLIDKFYDYKGQHIRHGEVKGPNKSTWFDRVRGT